MLLAVTPSGVAPGGAWGRLVTSTRKQPDKRVGLVGFAVGLAGFSRSPSHRRRWSSAARVLGVAQAVAASVWRHLGIGLVLSGCWPGDRRPRRGGANFRGAARGKVASRPGSRSESRAFGSHLVPDAQTRETSHCATGDIQDTSIREHHRHSLRSFIRPFDGVNFGPPRPSVKDANGESSEDDVPRLVGVISKLDVLVCESAADEDVFAIPRDASELVDGRASIPRCDLEALERPRIASGRVREGGRWRFLAERLVRSLVVVLAAKRVERALLTPEVGPPAPTEANGGPL